MQVKEGLIAHAFIKDTNWKVVRRYMYILDKNLRERLYGNNLVNIIEDFKKTLIVQLTNQFKYEVELLKYKIEIQITLKCFIN